MKKVEFVCDYCDDRRYDELPTTWTSLIVLTGQRRKDGTEKHKRLLVSHLCNKCSSHIENQQTTKRTFQTFLMNAIEKMEEDMINVQP